MNIDDRKLLSRTDFITIDGCKKVTIYLMTYGVLHTEAATVRCGWGSQYSQVSVEHIRGRRASTVGFNTSKIADSTGADGHTTMPHGVCISYSMINGIYNKLNLAILICFNMSRIIWLQSEDDCGPFMVCDQSAYGTISTLLTLLVAGRWLSGIILWPQLSSIRSGPGLVLAICNRRFGQTWRETYIILLADLCGKLIMIADINCLLTKFG